MNEGVMLRKILLS